MAENQMSSEQIKEKIVDVLKTVYDPEIPVDIYQLGMINVIIEENLYDKDENMCGNDRYCYIRAYMCRIIVFVRDQ